MPGAMVQTMKFRCGSLSRKREMGLIPNPISQSFSVRDAHPTLPELLPGRRCVALLVRVSGSSGVFQGGIA